MISVATGRLELVRDTTYNEHLTTAARSLVQIQTIISDVLTMARQGQSVEETKEVQLATVVEQCWESVATADANLIVEADARFRRPRPPPASV